MVQTEIIDDEEEELKSLTQNQTSASSLPLSMPAWGAPAASPAINANLPNVTHDVIHIIISVVILLNKFHVKIGELCHISNRCRTSDCCFVAGNRPFFPVHVFSYIFKSDVLGDITGRD
jgi:hypothetical protein